MVASIMVVEFKLGALAVSVSSARFFYREGAQRRSEGNTFVSRRDKERADRSDIINNHQLKYLITARQYVWRKGRDFNERRWQHLNGYFRATARSACYCWPRESCWSKSMKERNLPLLNYFLLRVAFVLRLSREIHFQLNRRKEYKTKDNTTSIKILTSEYLEFFISTY